MIDCDGVGFMTSKNKVGFRIYFNKHDQKQLYYLFFGENILRRQFGNKFGVNSICSKASVENLIKLNAKGKAIFILQFIIQIIEDESCAADCL